MTAPRIGWSGVFPAATTQFKPDLSVDYEATQRMQDALNGLESEPVEEDADEQ